MKRLALFLLTLNLLWAAWTLGLFLPWGWGPEQDQEPERFELQLRPDALQPVPPETPTSPGS